MRREAIEDLDNQRKNWYKREKRTIKTGKLIDSKLEKRKRNKRKEILLSGFANDYKQLEVLLSTPVDIIYYRDFINSDKVKELSEKYDKKLVLALNRISKDNKYEANK